MFCLLLKKMTASFCRSLRVMRIFWEKKGKIIIFSHNILLNEFSQHMSLDMKLQIRKKKKKKRTTTKNKKQKNKNNKKKKKKKKKKTLNPLTFAEREILLGFSEKITSEFENRLLHHLWLKACAFS